MNPETKNIMKEIQAYKGDKFIVLCAVEEMAEFSKELLKNTNRKKENQTEIADELADVLVCLEYIKDVYGISDDDLYKMINEKMPKKWLPRIEKWKNK